MHTTLTRCGLTTIALVLALGASGCSQSTVPSTPLALHHADAVGGSDTATPAPPAPNTQTASDAAVTSTPTWMYLDGVIVDLATFSILATIADGPSSTPAPAVAMNPSVTGPTFGMVGLPGGMNGLRLERGSVHGGIISGEVSAVRDADSVYVLRNTGCVEIPRGGSDCFDQHFQARQTLTAYDAKTGARRWQTSFTKRDFQFPMTIVDDALYFGVHTLTRVRTKDGTSTDLTGIGSLLDTSGTPWITVNTSGAIQHVDPRTSTILDTTPFAHAPLAVVGDALLSRDATSGLHVWDAKTLRARGSFPAVLPSPEHDKTGFLHTPTGHVGCSWEQASVFTPNPETTYGIRCVDDHGAERFHTTLLSMRRRDEVVTRRTASGRTVRTDVVHAHRENVPCRIGNTYLQLCSHETDDPHQRTEVLSLTDGRSLVTVQGIANVVEDGSSLVGLVAPASDRSLNVLDMKGATRLTLSTADPSSLQFAEVRGGLLMIVSGVGQPYAWTTLRVWAVDPATFTVKWQRDLTLPRRLFDVEVTTHAGSLLLTMHGAGAWLTALDAVTGSTRAEITPPLRSRAGLTAF